MPHLFPDVPMQTTQRAAFTLPCPVVRAAAYLSDPAVVFAALPSVERVIRRQQGTFRLFLAPIRVPGYALRPAAEVTIAAHADRIAIRGITDEPHDLQPGEVPTRIIGAFALAADTAGCAVQAVLTLVADIPAHVLPPLMPRVIAERTIEALLIRRMKQEVAALTRDLVRGYPAWQAEGSSEFEVRSSKQD